MAMVEAQRRLVLGPAVGGGEQHRRRLVAVLGLAGDEVFDITGLEGGGEGPLPSRLAVRAGAISFEVVLRIDTPVEADYYRHGGILPYVLRQLRRRSAAPQ